MKEILLTEKEMVLLVLLYSHDLNMQLFLSALFEMFWNLQTRI